MSEVFKEWLREQVPLSTQAEWGPDEWELAETAFDGGLCAAQKIIKALWDEAERP